MKVAVTSKNNNLEADVDPRFGRCKYLIFVDTETMDMEAISNENASAMGGAGVQTAQDVVNKKTEAVITGNIGPNAYRTLSAGDVKVFTGANGSVKNVVKQFKNGELDETEKPNVGSHFGAGGRRGSGHGGKR
ncbi:MAG: NifB/NifX family molybdenum-iron cluster-binding protein [Candidatus Thermoplasmatota archaeon]